MEWEAVSNGRAALAAARERRPDVIITDVMMPELDGFLKARTQTIERRHAQRLTNLFAHAPVAIAVLRDAEHVFELANPHYLDLVGGRAVVGKSIREALPELAGQGIYELLMPCGALASRISANR